MRLLQYSLLLLFSGVALSAQADNDVDKQLDFGGLTRSYIVHTPPGMTANERLALVIVLHGGGGSARSTNEQTHFSAEADRQDFIVVYPNGTDRSRPLWHLLGRPGFNTWNAGSCCGYAKEHNVDDVGFIRAMVKQLEADYPINPKRIYATGISNGGMMAYRLACQASDIFAAIGPVSAVQTVSDCDPQDPVAIIHIHGTADQNVPLAGGIGEKSLDRTPKPSVMATLRGWLHLDGCPSEPQETQVAQDVTEDDYRGCRGNAEIAYYQVKGGGHAWPGGAQMLSILDRPTQEIDATSLIWNFFAAHPKP